MVIGSFNSVASSDNVVIGKNSGASASNQNFASKQTEVVGEKSGIQSQYNVDNQASKGQVAAQQQETR